MASRIIHCAIAKKIAQIYKINDFSRLLLGELLPDAYSEDKGTFDSHLKTSVCGGSKKTYDLDKFRTMFSKELKEDDLYRGYYLHLIQDICFRDFVYNQHEWNPLIPGNVERLHRDYALANRYVIETHDLENKLLVPKNFSEEAINGLYPFGTEQLVKDFDADFEPIEDGEFFFFTKELADAFITIACEQSIKELEALDQNSAYTDMYQAAWKNKVRSLFETTLNTRDLGGYQTTSGGYTKWSSMIRSDVMKYASEADIALLKRKKITTVIDMRTQKDVLKAPCSLQGVDGVYYWNIPIEEGSGVPSSADDVSASYMQIAEAKNIKNVFETMANAPDGVIFHCTAGKDRTGVVSAILLLLAGVSKKDIVWDYLVTKECNKPRFELIHKNFPDVDMMIIIPQERYMLEFLTAFCNKYGTAHNYLHTLGLSDDKIASLLRKLIE